MEKENGKTYNNILGKKESGLMQRQCQCLIEITAETDDKVISMSYSQVINKSLELEDFVHCAGDYPPSFIQSLKV